MRAAAKTRPAGATVAILTCAALAAATSAASQDAPAPAGRDVINGQVQLGDVFAGQTLQVQSAEQTTAQATAVGDIVSAIGQGADLSFTNRQDQSGAVVAVAATEVKGSSGAFAGVTSSASANAATAGACCGVLSGTSVQSADGRDVNAVASLTVGGVTDQVSNDAATVGNTQGWLSTNGAVTSLTQQTFTGNAVADAKTTATEVSGLAGSSATVVANDVTVQATNSAVDVSSEQTTGPGTVRAILTSQQNGGDTIAGQATATADNVTVQNDGGTTRSLHNQTNGADVTADAAYGLGVWNTAMVGAYGVGGSIATTTAGPTTELGYEQINTGAVTASASLLAGGGGGEAYVTATAVGNAVQGSACSTCNGGVGFYGQQSNSGAVRASAVYKGPATGAVTAAASAVGNTATYVVRSPGG